MDCGCGNGWRCQEAERLRHRSSALRQLAKAGKTSFDLHERARREYDAHCQTTLA